MDSQNNNDDELQFKHSKQETPKKPSLQDINKEQGIETPWTKFCRQELSPLNQKILPPSPPDSPIFQQCQYTQMNGSQVIIYQTPSPGKLKQMQQSPFNESKFSKKLLKDLEYSEGKLQGPVTCIVVKSPKFKFNINKDKQELITSEYIPYREDSQQQLDNIPITKKLPQISFNEISQQQVCSSNDNSNTNIILTVSRQPSFMNNQEYSQSTIKKDQTQNRDEYDIQQINKEDITMSGCGYSFRKHQVKQLFTPKSESITKTSKNQDETLKKMNNSILINEDSRKMDTQQIGKIYNPNNISISISPLLNQLSTTSNTQTNNKKICCNCKRSRCLKLYCECFAAGQVCKDCNCSGCSNIDDNEEERQTAMAMLIERNPNAFKPKVEVESGKKVQHYKGCNCKRSGCLKKYCECYQAGIKCSSNCKCEACKNTTNSGTTKKQYKQKQSNVVSQQQQMHSDFSFEDSPKRRSHGYTDEEENEMEDQNIREQSDSNQNNQDSVFLSNEECKQHQQVQKKEYKKLNKKKIKLNSSNNQLRYQKEQISYEA